MGIPVLILGESGTGKTYSIKNFNPDAVGVFAVEKSALPFRKKFRVAKNATYAKIAETLKKPKLSAYIIDDSQYLLVNELFDRSSELGYTKFTEMAKHFRDLIHIVNHQTPEDCIVYFLHHPETDANTGRMKAKTIGKMLDEKLTIEGCFNIVLCTNVENGTYSFITQANGVYPAKSPEEMFEAVIPNDLAAVDKAIRDYYEFNKKTIETKEEETHETV